ncbi:MAG: ABC transporter ATP-binding protein [Methanobacteriota archaeon]|nr:MAG: ABC transporter ATP-binding protein [Euryarchaeota archaeon]
MTMGGGTWVKIRRALNAENLGLRWDGTSSEIASAEEPVEVDFSQLRARGKARTQQTLWRLMSYVRPHWPYAVGVTAAIVSGAALELVQPWILGFILIGDVLGGGNLSRANLGLLPWVVLLLGVTFGFKQVSSFFKGYLSEVLGQKTVHRLRSEVYQSIEHLPLHVFDKSRSGELVSRVVSDVNEVEKVMTEDVANVVANGVMIVGSIGLLFLVNPGLALIVAPVGVLLVVVVNLFKRTIKRFSAKIHEAVADLTAKAFEVFSGIRIVKSFLLEHHEADEFRDRSLRMGRAKVRVARLSAVYSSSVDLLTFAALIGVIWYAAPSVVAGTIKLGALVAFFGLMDKMFKPLVQLSKDSLKVQKAIAAGDRIFEAIDAEQEALYVPGGLVPTAIAGRIEFDRVSFGYRPGRNVLEDLSLVIEPGETVAVVGPSGVGKSTIVSLLLRFYEPTSGRILIDGYPIDRINLGALRRSIGLVMQEPVLFSGSIRDNIKGVKLRASDDDVVRASQAANAHEFVARLPRGYDTQIGERGVSLSVGQRQRIAIARALLKEPSILILDEATSNIDSESESLIQDALRRLGRRRTMIIIGHRLSSIMDADRIVVLEGGGIVEMGTHDALIEKGGTYTRLYEAQIDRVPREPTHDELVEP